MSYTAYILAACKLYLDFSVIRESPDNLPEINENYLEQFMTELISGGVFGGNGLENPYENMLIKSMDSKKERFGENKIILFFRLLSKAVFIQPEKLGVRYAYAKKRHWLLPAAWAHRIGYILLKRRSSVPRFQRSILRLIGSGDRFDYLRSIGLIK
jgi:hypothetical protein